MSMPPLFQRRPRLVPDVPRREIVIPPPPPAPPLPASSAGRALIEGFVPDSPVAMVASSVDAVIKHATRSGDYQRQMQERETRYTAFLATQRQELSALRLAQQQALQERDPDPAACLLHIQQRAPQLWARTPDDADFLAIRLGVGMRSSSVVVRPPPRNPLAPDPLVDRANELAAEYAHVPDLPVCLPLRASGVAGLVGPRAAMLATVRALALQLATHHSPDEVKLVALYPPEESAAWDWMRWLPHTWTDDRRHRWLANDQGRAHALLQSLAPLLGRRAAPATPGAALPLPVLVFFLADPRLFLGEPLFSLLLAAPVRSGAFSIFLEAVDGLPHQCRAIVDAGAGELRLLGTDPAGPPVTFSPDAVPPDLAEHFARAMAPLRLRRIAPAAAMPDSISLLQLLHADSARDLNVASRWRAGEPFRSLSVPLGVGGDGAPLALDLHEGGHGPHGLVTGTTGAGKSELLQTLIAALAIHFDPRELAFVVVDYKGGALAAAFQGLPHLIGAITNAQGNLAPRALAALSSELLRREALLAKAQVRGIDDYQRRYRRGEVTDPLAHLVVIVDEFSELQADRPEVVRDLISASRRGRSLGVHLVLATQKPSGVVDEQMLSNAHFRICLRVERVEDSVQVIGRADAAALTRPGQALLQVGHDELFASFQTAWAGAPYSDGSYVTSHANDIAEVRLDGTRHPLRLSPQPLVVQATSSEVAAVVAYLADVAQREGIARRPGLWLPPLPNQVYLDQVRPAEGWNGRTWEPAGTWLEPVIGMLDNPGERSQGPLRLPIGRDGHVIVYGRSGSGKTTLVQTLVQALAQTHSPADLQFYLVDFGGRMLALLGDLPHVGDVILPEDPDRLPRLLRYLQQRIADRQRQFSAQGVPTLADYRAVAQDRLPAIVAVLDNYSALLRAHPEAEETLSAIARDGGRVGIHLVVTADSFNAVRAQLRTSLSVAVVLALADNDEYRRAGGRPEGLDAAAAGGRGVIQRPQPLEFQTAFPATGADAAERSAALKATVQALRNAWTGPRPPPIGGLPHELALDAVVPLPRTWPANQAAGAVRVPLGVNVQDLEPFAVELYAGPYFLVAGPISSGKTTLLQTWTLALAEYCGPAQIRLVLVDFRQSGLRLLEHLPQVQHYAADAARFGVALATLEAELEGRRQALAAARQSAAGGLDERAFVARYPALVLVLDDYDAFHDAVTPDVEERLERLLRGFRGLGVYLMLAGTASDLGSSFANLIRYLKEMQIGFLLGSSNLSDLLLFNLQLPPAEVGKPLSAGQGYYTRRARPQAVKVATAHVGSLKLAAWVERLAQRGRSG